MPDMTRVVPRKRIRLGMVGGGRDAFIGNVHRIAARIDDHFELVAGVLSSSEEKARASALEVGLSADRSYRDYAEMAAREAEMDDGIEAVSIVTPNHLHLPVARAFLESGIHVICDKPLAASLDEAKELTQLVQSSEALFILTHNYTGYPMVRQAREMVASGDIGAIRMIQVEYAQDWLSKPIELQGSKQAQWRTDPKKSGLGGCIGDIGTHAFNLVRFVSGLKVHSICADLSRFVEGRRLDDNAQVLMRFEGGARGHMWCSQVAVGNDNALRIRVFGTTGSLDWEQESPDRLWFAPLGEPKRMLIRGGPSNGEAAERMTRIPAGHPEGYLEGFAGIYSEAARVIRAIRDGDRPSSSVVYPDVRDGLEGVAFVASCVASAGEGGTWIRLHDDAS